MKTHPHECDRERIDAFLDSDRFGLEDAELTDHLSTCEECRAYLESRAADQGTWTDAATMLAPTGFDQATTAEFSAAFPGPPRVEQSALIRQVLKTLSPTDDPHRLGRIGEYEVTGVVGAGGMGVVLKAVDPSLDRVVAIKVMSPYLAHRGTARKRFEREAKAAAAVLHPNVIPIHSVYGGDPVPYLVMAYIRGGSLQKRLDREGPLPTLDILRIGAQVAAGLAAAHEQGLIHRDIKPENILLEEGVERVTITDFGLARTVDDTSVTQTQVISGTPRYMSPEQARGDALDQQSDLFSLGSVLYTLCTGRPPFRADTSFGVMRRINEEAPTPIREINPDIPDWLALMVEKLMAKDKAERYGSAGEVHKLLEACLSHVQQPTHTELPASLRKRQAPTQLRRGLLPLLTSKHGVLTMIGLLTAGILAFTVPTLIDTNTNTEPAPPAAQQVEGAIAGDLKLLQGEWEVLSVTQDGHKEVPGNEGFGSAVLVIKGNTFSITGKNTNGRQTEGESGLIEISSSKNPKTIDLVSRDNPDDRLVGIYEIKDDTLRICWLEQSNIDVAEGKPVNRPTTFDAPVGREHVLIECRRPIQEPDLEQLQGEWEYVSAIENGQPEDIDEADLANIQIKIDGKQITFSQKRGNSRSESEAMLIEIDSTKSPKTIDLVSPNNPDDRHVGIYELKNGTLKLCMVEQSNIDVAEGRPVKRPTAFESPKGSEIFLLELRKAPRDQGDVAEELKAAQGMWEVTRSVADNRPIVTNDKAFLSVNGSEFTFIEIEDGEAVEKPMRLIAKTDASFNPAIIDLYDDKGVRVLAGIFEVKDNNMKLCFVKTIDQDGRPDGFVPPVGEGARLVELKRVGPNNEADPEPDNAAEPVSRLMREAHEPGRTSA